MTNPTALEVDFHKEMMSIYEKAKAACDYKPIRFLQMIQEHGGVETAKRLLAKEDIQAGLTTLWECRRLDLSMEALVLKIRFQALFTQEEIATARDRLKLYG